MITSQLTKYLFSTQIKQNFNCKQTKVLQNYLKMYIVRENKACSGTYLALRPADEYKNCIQTYCKLLLSERLTLNIDKLQFLFIFLYALEYSLKHLQQLMWSCSNDFLYVHVYRPNIGSRKRPATVAIQNQLFTFIRTRVQSRHWWQTMCSRSNNFETSTASAWPSETYTLHRG